MTFDTQELKRLIMNHGCALVAGEDAQAEKVWASIEALLATPQLDDDDLLLLPEPDGTCQMPRVTQQLGDGVAEVKCIEDAWSKEKVVQCAKDFASKMVAKTLRSGPYGTDIREAAHVEAIDRAMRAADAVPLVVRRAGVEAVKTPREIMRDINEAIRGVRYIPRDEQSVSDVLPGKPAVTVSPQRVFPMSDPHLPIPWAVAQVIYAGDKAIGQNQSLEVIARRGGYGWAEVATIYGKPQGRAAIDAAIHSAGINRGNQ